MKIFDFEQLQRKYEDFKWENYRREYRNVLKELKRHYWTLIALDVFYRNQSRGKPVDVDLFRSYMVVFYKPNDLELVFRKYAKGFNGYYLTQNQRDWNTWREDLRLTFRSNYFMLEEILKQKNVLKPLGNEERLEIKIDGYDHLHTPLKQYVSRELLLHTKYSTDEPMKSNSILEFSFEIDPVLAESADRAAEDYFRSRFLYGFLSRLENDVTSSKDPFGARRFQSLNQAIIHLTKLHGETIVDDLVILQKQLEIHCRDAKGKPFNNETIKTHWRRNYSKS